MIAPTAPFWVRPSTGVAMHSLVDANPDVPASYEPELPKALGRCLQVLREVNRTVTVAEVAARTGHPLAVAAVVVTELATLDLVRVVRAPAWAHRLRAWAAGSPAAPVVAAVIKVLIICEQEEVAHQASLSLSGDGPWLLQGQPRIEITTTRVAEDLNLLALSVSDLESASPLWSDLRRDTFGAVIITGTTPQDLKVAHESLTAVTPDVPAVLLVHEADETTVDTDVVRASVGLSTHTPLVVGDARGHGVREAIMDLCSARMNGVER